MLAMKQHYPILNFVRDIVCDACHKAKQKKLMFPNSDSQSLSSFILIYVDIRGPCLNTFIHDHKYSLIKLKHNLF